LKLCCFLQLALSVMDAISGAIPARTARQVKANPFRDIMTQMMEAEYAQISETERDGWAYHNTYDERCTFLKITPVSGLQPVVRLNPEYRNKKLPRSAIQILTFNRLTNTDRYTRAKEEWLKNGSPGYSLERFLEAFDINTLAPAIDK
jgi:hypothetical protein